MPPTYEERERLTDAALVSLIGDEIRHEVWHEWDTAETRCRHPGPIAELEKTFRVLQADTGGGAYDANLSHVISVTLAGAGLPANLHVHAFLTIASDGSADVARFVSTLPRYVEVAKAYAASQPEKTFVLRYTNGESVTDHSIAQWQLRMEPPTAEEVSLLKAQRKDAALVGMDGFPGLIVFVLPDGRVLPWRQ